MVSTEEALKKIEERAKKTRKPHSTTSTVRSPFRSPSGLVEREKEKERSVGMPKEKKSRKELIGVDDKPVSINLPPKTSLWKNPGMVVPVCSQLLLKED